MGVHLNPRWASRHTLRTLIALGLCLLQAGALHAQNVAAPARPKVALVLSGGGARGFAHIGVLRALRDMQIPVDMVLGTSMGGVIGGAFAAGVSVDELEKLVHHTDWDSVIADRPARDDLSFRRREEDVLLPSRIEFGVNGRGVTLPPAAAGNAALELALARMLPPGTRDTPVSHLALPFRSVASDLLSGELVELVDTPLFLAMRASLAVPGVFAPVRVNQRLVVDGGLVRNLPVDMARAMGADIVIAVNVGTPLAPESELGSAVGVAQQMLQILTEQNVQRSIKELGPRDILIAPDLSGIGFLDFQSHDKAIKAGEQAARMLAGRLAPLALAAPEYAQRETRRLAAPAQQDRALPLARLEVQHEGNINPDALNLQSGLQEGQLVTLDQVRQAAATLYGRGDLAHVETDVRDSGGKRHVSIRSTEADWASSRVRVGLELASDFKDSNTFALKLMHVRSSLNSWGAELRTVAGIGSERSLGVQFWQPLGAGSPWFVAPSLEFGSLDVDIFNEGRRLLRYASSSRGVTLIGGRQLGNWGNVELGLTRQVADAQPSIPDSPLLPTQHGYGTVQFVRVRVDTLDSLAFPSRGYLLDARWERSYADGAYNPASAQSTVQALSAFHTLDWAGHLYAEWAHAQSGTALMRLGGFLNLSGTQAGAIDGHSVALSRLVMARRIGAMPAPLGGAVRVGFSLELGAAFDRDQPLKSGALKQAGSAFIALDTRFGPLYVAAGATRGVGSTVYLFLGPVW